MAYYHFENKVDLLYNGFIVSGLSELDICLRTQLDSTPFFNAAKNLETAIETLGNNDVKSDLESVHCTVSRMYFMAEQVLNTGHYSSVEVKYRTFFAYVCALFARFEFYCQNYFEAIRRCDDGLIKGNDLENNFLSKFASYLCRNFLPKSPLLRTPLSEERKSVPKLLKNSTSIDCLTTPSMEKFNLEYLAKNRPLIIRGMVDKWPAFNKWSFSYLNEMHGHRTVPVELGSKYTDENWCQKLMTFHEYLANYVFTDCDKYKMGYLAQHRLLDQVPELLEDIIVPDYCAFVEDGLNEDKLNFNVFIGPGSTISPLHTDPRHNFFCQIGGRKFVRLINTSFKEKLYLYEDLMRKNTSQVNVEDPEFEKFPAFRDVFCEDFIVEPGDCLFIPRGYFHFVKALQRSISVSIWFGD